MSGDMCHFGQISDLLKGKPVSEWKPVFEEARKIYPCCADKVRNYHAYQYQLEQLRARK